jgi:cardiolipin synthase
VARRFRQGSRAGELIDPITDKLFVLCTLAAFLRADVVRLWELALLLLRDIFALLAFAAASALRLPIHFRARFSGKVVTTLQLAAALTFTAVPQGARTAVLITAAASVWAIADYTRFGLRSLRGGAHAG